MLRGIQVNRLSTFMIWLWDCLNKHIALIYIPTFKNIADKKKSLGLIPNLIFFKIPL